MTSKEEQTGNHIIKKMEDIHTNLVETNTYLTRKIVDLKLNSSNFTPETIQPHQMLEPTPIKRMSQPTPQKSWAQVANNTHKNVLIQPPKQNPTKQCPTTQEKMADPCCLTIQVSPPILATERPNGIDTWNRINSMLEKRQIPHYFWVMAVSYSVAGNIKIMTTHACKASDLLTYGEDIAAIITNNKVILVLPDEEHYRIKVNKIPTWYDAEHPMTINNIHKELTAYIPEYDIMKKW